MVPYLQFLHNFIRTYFEYFFKENGTELLVLKHKVVTCCIAQNATTFKFNETAPKFKCYWRCFQLKG